VLEELDGTFVLLGRLVGAKSAQVFSLACARVELSGVKAILSGFQFANHGYGFPPGSGLNEHAAD
jgi:hypothetical protein